MHIQAAKCHASRLELLLHLGMHPATAAKVGQAQAVVRDQDVFWLDIAVENAISVHMRQRLQQLEHQPLQCLLAQPARAALDQFVQVLLHQFEHQRQLARRRIAAQMGMSVAGHSMQGALRGTLPF